ncbi:MAG TPA: alpha/beta hydrolase [Desulfobacterales bacterium]|nr:alpha/beta hydrolase [Desulfobacterales bacterium]
MKKINFPSEGCELEALLDQSYDEDKGAVITHPHPLYGGDMYNIVVESIAKVYKRMGYTTLRPNFRGVGKSRGSYDNGIGEQADVRFAISYLSQLGVKDIDLAGYSYGAWVNAHVSLHDMPVKNMIMVSPPLGFMDFLPVSPISRLKLVVTGSRDEIAPAGRIKKILPTWNPETQFEVIDGANHFFEGYLEELESVLYSGLR